jgi:hypothetical protein
MSEQDPLATNETIEPAWLKDKTPEQLKEREAKQQDKIISEAEIRANAESKIYMDDDGTLHVTIPLNHPKCNRIVAYGALQFATDLIRREFDKRARLEFEAEKLKQSDKLKQASGVFAGLLKRR